MDPDFHKKLVVVDACQYSNWDRELFVELQKGGVSAVLATIVYWEDARQTLSIIGKWHQLFRNHSDIIVPVQSADDILEAKRFGKTAIMLGLQNISPIENEIFLVSVFRELGVCTMQLTYNNQSLVGSGVFEAEDTGITRFGREVIKEMNKVGMIIDLSHSGDRTVLHAIEISERPVAITHANPKSWHPAIRNMTDDVLKSLAASGGMLGLCLYPLHLHKESNCSLDDFCSMVARTAELMGVDKIGIGSDTVRKWEYDTLHWMRNGTWTLTPDFGEDSTRNQEWPKPASWFQTPADFPNITKGLLEIGFSEEDVAKIMGLNWLRFFKEGMVPRI
jgi:microsomal dipeptidase-like Zn-dependent dipeptidase